MIRQRLTPAWFALAIAPLTAFGLVAPAAQATTVPTQSCSYDPASGKSNPLGNRAAIMINEINGDTTFTYQEIPTRANRGPSVVVVAPKREITLENTGLDDAKQLLVDNPNFYNDLIGYESASGFSAVSASLTCWSNDLDADAPAQATLPARQIPATTAPTISPREIPSNPVIQPAQTSPQSNAPRQRPSTTQAPGAAQAAPRPTAQPETVAAASPRQAPLNLNSLPDGSYRLWNGNAKGQDVSDAQLLEEGGALFIFTKAGDRITGNFAHIDGENSYCVYGQGNRGTVSGFVYPYNEEALDLGEDFRTLGPSGFLKVRRTRLANDKAFYSSALLDLSSFQPINLGPVSPPSSCQS